MADNTLALQVQPTQFGNNFSAGFNNGLNQQAARQQQEAQAFEQLATLGLGVMNGNPDGEIDPAKLEQAIGLLHGNPLAEKVKENPELLRTITKGSMNVLQFVRDGEKFELAKKELELQLAKAQETPPPEAPKTEEFYDETTGQPYKAIWDAQAGKYVREGGVRAPTQGQTINIGPNGEEYGDPGAGLVWQRDKDGKVALDDRGAPIAIPFQGGKVWEDQQAAAKAAAAGDTTRDTAANIVVEDIGRALEKIKKDPFWTTGLLGGWLSSVGGTPAGDAKALIDTVKANAAFDKLQAMREASKTGAALGAVTERELSLLQAAIGNLEQSQSGDQLVFNLGRVKKIYQDIIDGPGQAKDDSAADDMDPSTMSDEDLLTILGAP